MPTRRAGHRFRRLAAVLIAVVAAASGLAAAPASAAVAGPVLDRDLPDPDIVKAGGTYHAYATNGDGKNI